MKLKTTKLEDLKQLNYQLDFGQALEQAFENYKKIVWISGAVILVVAIVFYAVAFGIFASIMGATFLTDLTEFQNEGVTTTMLIANLVGGILMTVIIAPLSAGILQMAHNAQTFKEVSFATAFVHYKGKYVKDLLLASFIVAFTTNVISFAAELSFPAIDENGLANGENFLVKLLIILISLFASLLTVLTAPLIIFAKLNAVDAVKGSIALVSKKFFIFLGLFFVVGIFALLGAFACCVGMVFTIPLIYSMQYVVYRTAVNIEEEDELDQIGFGTDL